MAEPRTRLGRILQQEYQSKGIVGGTFSALGKRSLEKLDIRNSLFGGSGLGSVIGQKIFGKGYSATKKTGAPGVEKISELSQNLNSSVLQEINTNSRISAKNSVVLPSMARDMNLMRMNIIKLVKLQGGTPAMKADMFFSRAKEREMLFENQYAKNKISKNSNSKTPEKIAENKNIFQSILDGLGGTFLPILMGRVISVLSSPAVIASLAALVGLIALSRTTPGKLFPESAKKSDQKELERALKESSTPEGRERMAKEAEDFSNRAIPENKLSKQDIQDVRDGKKIFYRPLNPDTGKTEYKVADRDKAVNDYKRKTSGYDSSKLSDEQKKIADLIYTRFIEAGFNEAQATAALANAYAESSFNPSAKNITDKEESYGLFQMNRKGGLGQDYTPEQLKDPETNIAIAIREAKKSKNFVQSTNVEGAVKAFVEDVERPKDKLSAISKRTSVALAMQPKNTGEIINQSSLDNGVSKVNTGVNQVAVNNNNITNNSGGGGSSGQLSSADVMDTELGRLLLTRMY
jgi:hypothetical protein